MPWPLIQGHAVTHPATFAMVGAEAALRHRSTARGAEPDVGQIVQRFEKTEGPNRRTSEWSFQVFMLRGLPAGAFYAFADVSS